MSALAEKKAHTWARDALDWYVEPVEATFALLAVEKFIGPVCDPCCGQGNTITALHAAGYRKVCGSDIRRRVIGEPDWFVGEADFLKSAGSAAPNIIMNPPFFRAKGAEAFIRKALEVASGKVCAFVDIKFLAGAGRANGLFAEHPPQRVWIVTPRVSCPPGEALKRGAKAEGGTADWCWLVWDRSALATGTALGWLRRSA